MSAALTHYRREARRANRKHNITMGLFCFAISAMPVGLILSAPVMHQPRIEAGDFDPAHRLIGLGCGPKRQTFTANEEDHFPAPCFAIDTPRNLCGSDINLDAAKCAAYLGEGW